MILACLCRYAGDVRLHFNLPFHLVMFCIIFFKIPFGPSCGRAMDVCLRRPASSRCKIADNFFFGLSLQRGSSRSCQQLHTQSHTSVFHGGNQSIKQRGFAPQKSLSGSPAAMYSAKSKQSRSKKKKIQAESTIIYMDVGKWGIWVPCRGEEESGKPTNEEDAGWRSGTGEYVHVGAAALPALLFPPLLHNIVPHRA